VRDQEVKLGGPTATDRLAAAELAARAARRDPDAWAQLFEDHFHSVYAYVRSRLPGPQVAEDLASQVFEIAYTRASTFDYRGLPIEAWLFGIARNLVRDHVKRLARRGATAELVEAGAAAVGEDAPARVDLQHDLLQAMRHLTDDQQAVLVHRFLLDRSVNETAVRMGRSEDAIKNLQRRALAAMHRALVAGGYDEARLK
jgi:RNA polymerase sigma-70 factor (ECF subfamily)